MDLQDFLDNNQKVVVLNLQEKTGQLTIAAVAFYRLPNALESTCEEVDASKSSFQLVIDIYEFLDNQQLSGLDAFCNQVGEAIFILSDDFEGSTFKLLSKKLNQLFDMKKTERKYVKKTLFQRRSNINILQKFLLQKNTLPESLINKIEMEKAFSITCIECLSQLFNLPDGFPTDSSLQMVIKSLDSHMKLDSAACDAINLLPKSDQPSIYGSIYGILNRCKTKMGMKTLERWMRQPLLSLTAIEERLNLVELFYSNSILRNKLRDGPLKNIPDLDTVSSKLRKKTAGLQEMFRLYLFVKSLPALLQILQEFGNSENMEDDDEFLAEKKKQLFQTLQTNYLQVLLQISGKFSLYEQLIEHIIDFNALPEYKINPIHDSELQSLAEEQSRLEECAEKILNDAKSGFASFAEVRLERSSQYGFNLRTTKGDDEKQLRNNNSSVKILSILKNGCHFTTPALERMATRYLSLEREYQEKQSELVEKALETALTYLPLIESVAVLVSEIDVLQSFAHAAAISPNGYSRPVIHEKGTGIMKIKVSGRETTFFFEEF
jgi:DNA mismatch repair protein MSH2